MAFDSAAPVDAASKPFEFVSESLAKQGTIMDTNAVRGTRSHGVDRTRTGVNTINGTIVLNPAPKMLDNLLPLILGASESTTTANLFKTAETLSSGVFLISRGAKDFLYQGCWVNRATLRASQGQFLELALDIEAETETVQAAGTYSGLTFSDSSTMTEKPYVFMDGTFSVLSSNRSLFSFELVIDNHLNTERYLNSVNRADLPAQDRTVTVRMSTPYTADEVDLYDQALAGAAATFTFTNADDSAQILTISLAALQFPSRSPVVPGKTTEIPLQLEGVARETSTTKEIVITNADT